LDNNDNKEEELEKNLEAAKKELAKQDIKRYREEVVKKNLDNRLKKNGLKIEDLSTTAKQNYEKLNSDTETNRQEIDKTEQEILTEVGKSSLDKLIAETEQALKSGDKKKIENKIKELQKFVNSQIDYKKNAYEIQNDKVQSLLEKSKTQQYNQNGFFRPNNPLM